MRNKQKRYIRIDWRSICWPRGCTYLATHLANGGTRQTHRTYLLSQQGQRRRSRTPPTITMTAITTAQTHCLLIPVITSPVPLPLISPLRLHRRSLCTPCWSGSHRRLPACYQSFCVTTNAPSWHCLRTHTLSITNSFLNSREIAMPEQCYKSNANS